MLFPNTVCYVPKKLRTQYKEMTVDDWAAVECCILDMFDDDDDFAVLTKRI